ncbi:ABC transporter permease [Candidatus Saccharibacteria bacterium]|nr:ABC transporter permease [Candidatus Saccharibacteria bacterium]
MNRQMITLRRVMQYGFYNFMRNTWLTTAATIVMTITLLVIVSSIMLRMIFEDTIGDIRKRIDVSIYLKDDITDAERQKLETALRKLPIVTDVEYVSKDQALDNFREGNRENVEQLNAIKELQELQNNPLPASLRVKNNDPSRLKEISDLATSNQFKSLIAPDIPPSNAGERRAAIDNIAQWSVTFQNLSLIASIIFIVISVLIIFNTIRMAIYNRKDEIEMMRLIGANPSFIRGPFIVEATLYGTLAALICSALLYAFILAQPKILGDYAQKGILIEQTFAIFQHWPFVVIPALIAVGVAIGFFSSTLAIQRYLKDK